MRVIIGGYVGFRERLNQAGITWVQLLIFIVHTTVVCVYSLGLTFHLSVNVCIFFKFYMLDKSKSSNKCKCN